MAEAAAAEVLGPRPGLAIVSFGGGRLEICLRVLAPFVSFRLYNISMQGYKVCQRDSALFQVSIAWRANLHEWNAARARYTGSL